MNGLSKRNAIVIGAGWAGLSAAVELAERGWNVTVLEQSGRLGGRASSFFYEKTQSVVDNGQHLLMGCYINTIAFLEKISALKNIRFHSNLAVHFYNSKAEHSELKCWNLPAPLHLFSGLLGLESLSWKDKWNMRKVHQVLQKELHPSLKAMTVLQWLKSLGQSEQSIKNLWEPITLATLNEKCSIAQAHDLAVVLKEAFFSSKEKSAIGIAQCGLSQVCSPAVDYLQSRGGKILNGQLVTKIETENGEVKKILLRDGTSLQAEVYISAVPFFILENLLEKNMADSDFFSPIKNLKTSPIFSISLWLDRPVVDFEFAALIDTETHWVFNKNKIFPMKETKNYLSLVLSSASHLLEKSNEELLDLCWKELTQCLPQIKNAKIEQSLIQREKNATLSPEPGYDRFRLPQKTPVKNLFICGDWTQTGLPATIESAVLSGVKAAALIS